MSRVRAPSVTLFFSPSNVGIKIVSLAFAFASPSHGTTDRAMRILFITPYRPYPHHSGGEQRTNLLYRALRSVAEVDLVIVSSEPVQNREELQRDFNLIADFVYQRPGDRPPFRWFLGWKPHLAHKIAKMLLPLRFDYRPDRTVQQRITRLIAERGYDVIVGRYLLPTIKSGVIGAGHTLALDVDDLDTQVYRSRLMLPGRPPWERMINRWHYCEAKKIIPLELRKFDLVWITNQDPENAPDETNDLISRVYLPNIPVNVIDAPLNEETFPAPSAPGGRPVILFVGNFWTQPNRLGVEHFVNKIWPTIRAAKPTAVFRIVGSGQSEQLRERWNSQPGVEAVGFVEDAAACYGDCRFSVVPLFSGAGTNIKVVESLSLGRTCVLTPFSHRGYSETLHDRQDVLIAKTDAAFADACIELLRDPALCETLARHGRDVVAKQFSFERFRQIVADSIARLLRA